MRAVVFGGVGEVEVADVPEPQLQDREDVLVRVSVAGICGSDLHIYEGRTPVEPGALLGHEFAGEVVAAGEGVSRFKPGQRVVSSFYTACGHCGLCRRGWFSQCVEKRTFGHGEFFGGLGGGQAELIRVPGADRNLESIPEGVSDESALFVGDILATAYFGAERANIKPGDSVAVIGAGPVGLLAVICAPLFGAARVFAVDMVPARLRLAKRLGAIPIDLRREHPGEAIRAATSGLGADACIECVGAAPALETALDCVRGGASVSSVGVPNQIEGSFPYMQAWLRDLSFSAGWCNVHVYMRPLLELIAAGRLQPEAVVSHRLPLDDAVEAYELFAARKAAKVLLNP
jgi:2-desacetyl-2-hydroxyethyl bacteriochlorophyllide A dehydrogenase